MSSTSPLLINSQTLVSMKELDNANSSLSNGTNLSDGQFETYICRNLANQTHPVNLSNEDYSTPNSLSIIDSSLNNTTIINNNDNVLVNENFAMKMNYISSDPGARDQYNYTIGDYIPANIKLNSATNSLYDSNIKIDISLNKDTQYTPNNSWAVNYDREHTSMNYFSAINSYLQDASGVSPFYVVESSSNIYALGNSALNTATQKFFIRNTSSIPDNSGTMVPVDISTNSLDANHCGSYLDNNFTVTTGGVNPYVYTFNEFTSFKIVQDTPHITTTLKDLNTDLEVNGNLLSVRYNGVDISAGTFDFSGVFLPVGTNPNEANIGNGFQMTLSVGDIQDGGYSLDGVNSAFTINDTDLTKNVNNPYLKIDQQNSVHKLTINNGDVVPSSQDNTSNSNYITMGTEAETLASPYNNEDGFVKVYVNPVNNRVYYPLTGGSNSFQNVSKGTKSSLTDYVDVVYNASEASGYNTNLSENSDLLVTDDVEYYVKILASSTANASSFSNQNDNRNLATNNSAILVVASSQSPLPSSPNVADFTFTSNVPVNSQNIQIISIENNSMLTEQTQLLDPSGNAVSGTNATVSIQNVDLSGLIYSDYLVKLNTKTVTDISNLAQLQGGWTFATTNPSVDLGVIQGTPLKTSVLYDDYLFMTNHRGLDISMNYEFKIANPIITSTQAIKRTIQISFKDVFDNVSYSPNNTVFYLDDQDITISPLSENIVEDESCTNIVVSNLNNNNYSVDKYNFKKYTKTTTYTATFDSKFPFYTNLLLKTPTITERSIYYKMFDLLGNEQPSYLLKYFKCGDDNQLLSDVYVSLPNGPHSVNFLLTPSICSIFNAELEGKNPSNNFVTIPITNTPPRAPANTVPLDPFFNLTSLVNGIDNASGIATITVKFNNAAVNKLYYTIDTQNAPGTNIALHGKKYTYNIASDGNELDTFTPYNDFFNTLENMTQIDVRVSNDILGNQTVTIYDTNGTTVLATVVHRSNFINNYNIIVCLWPFAQVVTKYNSVEQSDVRLLAINNTLNVDSGVYYHLNSAPAINAAERFRLMSDSFKLRYVNNNAFPNNLDSIYNSTNGVSFTESIIDGPIVCGGTVSNHARSVEFSRLRGWERAGSGVDTILLDRSLTTYTFSINISGGGPNVNNTSAIQNFNNVNVGTTLTVNAVAGQGPNTQTYNLGLKINPTQSIIGTEDVNVYTIYASVANFLANIDSNPYNPSIIGILNSGYVTDNQQLDMFYPYITGVKANCIKSYGSYSIQINREIPNLKVYNLTTPNFIGDPRNPSNSWHLLGTIPFNNFAWRGYVASNLNVFRRNNFLMFYNGYTSYYVVAPPSIDVYGYKYDTDIRSVPIRGFSSILFRSFDINNPLNLYTISSSTNTATSELRLSQPSVFSYARYLNSDRTKYRFQIQGNKVRIAIYNGGVGNYGSNSAPDTIDANSNPYEYIYPRTNDFALINNIQNVNNIFSVSLDASLNYNISYNQYLPGIAIHHSTENIVFSIGNAFNGIPPGGSPGYPVMYLRLKSSQGTNISFYQANIVYNDINGSNGYYMVIDKYNTDNNVNYNSILNGSIREVYFPVARHYTKQIPLSNGIVGANGNIINQNTFIGEIDLTDIDNVNWVQDNTFTLQYIGLTISALTNSGINALGDLLKYNSNAYLQSKALYVRRQDIIRVLNVLGNTTFRVTNSGNVQSQRVTTSAVSLYYPVNTPPESLGGIIGGSQDIMTLFAQDTLINGNPM